jgi:hypothetical protein
MISRIHGAHSTLAANPRKKRRKAAKAANPRRRRRRNPEGVAAASSSHSRKRKKARKLFAFRAVTRKSKKTGKKYRSYRISRNPATPMELAGMTGGSGVQRRRSSSKRRRSTSKYGVFSTGRGKFSVRKLRKNPALVIAGVPVIEMAIGSAAAIGLGVVADVLVKKYAGNVVPGAIADITGELVTAGVAAFAYSKLSNPMHKSIAQYAFIGAVFQIINKKTYEPIKGALSSVLPAGGYYHGGAGGVYFDPYTAEGAVGGAYLSTDGSHDMGGMYANVDGLGLFQAPSIYG